jgi:hypothetical protein
MLEPFSTAHAAVALANEQRSDNAVFSVSSSVFRLPPAKNVSRTLLDIHLQAQANVTRSDRTTNFVISSAVEKTK